MHLPFLAPNPGDATEPSYSVQDKTKWNQIMRARSHIFASCRQRDCGVSSDGMLSIFTLELFWNSCISTADMSNVHRSCLRFTLIDQNRISVSKEDCQSKTRQTLLRFLFTYRYIRFTSIIAPFWIRNWSYLSHYALDWVEFRPNPPPDTV